MFEKEALIYATVSLPDGYTKIDYQKKTDWQNGAEFGYKKGLSEQLVHKQYQLNQLRKANEWHYVKDGDLPKEFDKPYLCYLNGYFEVGYFMAYKEQPWHFDNYYLDNEDVDAWKEIVLPKESE